jgi:uncharacterized protein YjbI with pentapeptide repeats
LHQCHFAQAKLPRALFVQADCTYVDFKHADLQGADLRDAKLFRTAFHGALLQDAQFTDRTQALGTDADLTRAEQWAPA